MLRQAISNTNIQLQRVIELPAGTVLENIELARSAGISYTELGFYTEEKIGLIENEGTKSSDRRTITAPQTVKVVVEVDCNNWGHTMEGMELYDCMVRFTPY